MASKIEVDSLEPVKVNRSRQITFIIPIIGFALFLLCMCAPGMRQVQHEGDPGQVAVRFAYVDDQARTVCVSGSFNNWSEHSHCMSQSLNTWSVALALPPCRYQYLFVIDSRMRREDPWNVFAEDNGFGMKNSVLLVE
jgi:hypothetical protein